MVPFLPETCSHVLEIGCGTGVFRENLRQPHEYWGIEPEPSVAQIASRRLDQILTGTYQDMHSRLPDHYFDLVICNDVIEHMPDHDWFFESIKTKMLPGGYLICSIPNVRYIGNLFEILVRKDWQYQDMGIRDRTHLRFFTRKSLLRIFQQHGFRIEQFSGINAFHSQNWFLKAVFLIAILVFGKDTQYLQFGARLQYLGQENATRV